MSVIYEELTECRDRGCWITCTTDPRIPAALFIYQHGDNPEAVLLVDRLVAREDARQQLRAFTERCHAYEDGDAAGQ